MSAARVLVLAECLLGLALPAQQALWQVVGPANHDYVEMKPFGDFDHDGHRDVAIRVFPSIATSNQMEVRILSGLNGSVLSQIVIPPASIQYAGDVNGDGDPDLAIQWPYGLTNQVAIQIWSPATAQMLWQVWGTFSGGFGNAMLGDLDTDGDGFDDFIACTTHPNESAIYVYDHVGNLRYSVPLSPIGWVAVSLANMGDMDSDGCDDFLVGCGDPSVRGAMVLMSGLTGAPLRISYGLLPGDKTASLATNVGDIDGDGVNDYAGFPYWSAWRAIVVLWSGATGNVIRTLLPAYAESVIATEDIDLDGVNDLVLAWEYPVSPPNVYGRTTVISGRDGTELWHVDNFFGSGQPATGWGRYAAGLGVLPGSPYPAITWLDTLYWEVPLINGDGRIRAFRGTRAGQGPVTGTPCSSTGTLPQIGARATATGSRITIAKAPPGAVAWLNLALGNQVSYAGLPLPISLAPFGLPGCDLLVGPEASAWRVLGTTGIDRGYAAVDLNFQLVASLGSIVTAQWLVFDPTTFAYAGTAKHVLRMQ